VFPANKPRESLLVDGIRLHGPVAVKNEQNGSPCGGLRAVFLIVSNGNSIRKLSR
jgi:hypothetical protein